jgi:hypothetical protein
LELRGIHVEARGARAVPGLERLLTEIAPLLGLNWVIAELDSHFDYTTHPEIAEPNPITRQQAQRLARLARDNGINLVPMYNCLGHQSWGQRISALLRAHPEFNESPDVEMSADDFYCYSWCPSHPGVNPIIFELFDELLDAFQPRAFHVGMDEVFILGRCPRCRDSTPAELFARAVNDYHEHLVQRRGVQMQLWGDRLLPRRLGFSHWESSENGTEDAVDLVPKDMLICDWHYHLMEDYPSVQYLLDRGFLVATCGWKEPAAIRRLIEVSRREAAPGLLGYLCTTWCGVTDFAAAFDGEPPNPEVPYLSDVVDGVKLASALIRD